MRLKKKVRDKRLLLKGTNPEELIDRWENVIKDYCENNEIDFDASLDKGTLIVTNKHGFYIIAFVMKLMAIEDFKIPMVLDYQKGLASNKAEFIDLVQKKNFRRRIVHIPLTSTQSPPNCFSFQ